MAKQVWNLRSTISVDPNSIKEVQNTVKTVFKKAWDNAEKDISDWAIKWLEKIKKESEKTVITISKLNNSLAWTKKMLENTEVWTKAFKNLQKEIEKTEKELAKATWTWKNFMQDFSWMALWIWWVVWIMKTVDYSNIYTGMRNALSQVAQWDELDQLEQKILKTANNSRVPIDALTQSFVRFDMTNKQMWWNSDETLKMLDSLTKWLAMSGAKWSETSSVMLQLSQAFGSWVLQWDEFRSLAENMPMILDILAKQMWVTRWELKQLWSDWQITSAIIKQALLEANSDLTDSFENSQVTIEQKLTQIRNDFIFKFWKLDKEFWFTEKIVASLEFLRSSVWSLIETFPNLSLFVWWAVVSLTALSTLIFVLWPALGLIGSAFTSLTAFIGGTTGALILLRGALTFLTWPIWLIIWWITLLWWVLYSYREELWFAVKKTVELTESQKQINQVTENYKKKLEDLQKEQEDLNKRYAEGKIWNDEYKKSLEANKKAIDDLDSSHKKIKDALDIINNKQITYKEQIELINKLKLNDSEYQKIIWLLKTMQEERLKDLKLQQLQFKSKISWLEKPQEVLTAETDLKNAYDTKAISGGGALLTNNTNSEFLKYTSAVNQAKIKNSAEISKYNTELKKLQDQENQLLQDMRSAEDILKQKTTPKITTTSNNTWWKKTDTTQKEIKALEEKATKEIELIKNSELTESEKAIKILAINDKLEKDINEIKNKWYKNDVNKAKENIDEKMKTVKKSFNEYEKAQDKLWDVQEKYYKKALDYQKDIDSWISKNISLLKEQEKQYKKNIDQIEEQRKKELSDQNNNLNDKLATRLVDIWKEKKDLEEKLKDLKRENTNFSLDTLDRFKNLSKDTLKDIWTADLWWWITWEKLLELLDIKEKLAKLNKEEEDSRKIVSNELFLQKKAYDEASISQQAILDNQKELERINKAKDEEEKKAKEKYDTEVKRIEDLNKIYQIFNTEKNLKQETFNQVLKDKRFQDMSDEEQALIIKLWNEKLLLTQQKESIKDLEKDLNNTKIQLSKNSTELLTADVNTLSEEYKKLISDINKAIIAQKQLNSLTWKNNTDNTLTKLYADWWYTWDGGKYEEAWIVHKWEYVVPQAVLNKMPWLLPQLEYIRQQWWNISNDYSKKVDVSWPITVQNQADLESFFWKIKFYL